MSEKKTSIKTVAVIAGGIAAILALVALIVSFAIHKTHSDFGAFEWGSLSGLVGASKLWLWSLVVMGLYFCILRPYAKDKSLALPKEEQLLYFIFGGAVLAVLFHIAYANGLYDASSKKILLVLAMMLMWLAAVACLKYVWADKKIESKEYALTAVGVGAVIYAIFSLIALVRVKVNYNFFDGMGLLKCMYVLVSLALIAAAIFLIKDNYDAEEMEAAKRAALEAGERAKASAVEAGAKAKAAAIAAGEKAKDAAAVASEKAKAAGEKIADAAKETSDKIADAAKETKEKIADKVEDIQEKREKKEDEVVKEVEKAVDETAEAVKDVVDKAAEAIDESKDA